MEVLKCNKCQKTKIITDFVKDKYKPIGYRKICKVCRKKYLKTWTTDNIDKVNATRLKWLENNPEKRKLVSQEYFKRNQEKIQKLNKERLQDKCGKYYAMKMRHYNKNKSNILDACRIYRKNNKEQCNERIRKWKKTPEGRLSGLLSFHKRRAIILKTQTKPITPQDILKLLEKQEHKCALTNEDLNITGYHIDHIIPLSKGGTHTLDNLQLLTPTANLSKGCKI